MRFVGLGHSHIVALAKGAYALAAEMEANGQTPFACAFHYLYDAQYEPAFSDDGFNPRIVEALTRDNPDFALLSIGGNEHNVLSIAQWDPPYDFILGEDPDLPLTPRAAIFPEAAAREAIRGWLVDKAAVLHALRAASSMPLMHIEPPPPLPREQILAHPKEFFRSAMQARNLAPDTLRYKMWRVQTRLMRDLCAAERILYLETPPDLQDSSGLLRIEACGDDATHANESYGRTMVSQALQRLASAAAVASK